MAIVIIAPEILVLIAVHSFYQARENLEAAKAVAPEFEWSLTHGFYAQMGGFAYFNAVSITSLEYRDLMEGVPEIARQKLFSFT